VAFLSLSEIWTIFIPWLLIPLPYKIYKRTFNFTQIQTALWALPIASLLSLVVYEDPSLDAVVGAGLVFGLLLLFILRLPAMQRWGKPEAIIPKYIHPHDPKISNPTPVPFYVDYAFQDRAIAEEIITTLKKYGHPQAENIHEAKAVLALISRFKSDTEADPAKQVLFPVLIQTNNNISEKLSKIQWIDFRPGVRGLDTIAQLLANPKELLKALGMRPVSSQTVYSPVITAIYFFVILLTVINVGAALDYIFASDAMWNASDETFDATIISLIINLILFGGLAYLMVRGLTTRRGLFSSFITIIIGIVLFSALMFWQSTLDTNILIEMEDAGIDSSEVGISFINLASWIYFLGIAIIGLMFLRNRRDVKNWFPARK